MDVIHYLDRAQIGAWFGVSADAVRKWQERHDDFPPPEAIVGDRTPGWLPSREAEIRAWKTRLPGQGAPGRPKPRKAKGKAQPE